MTIGRGMGLPPRELIHSEADPEAWGDSLPAYVAERERQKAAKSKLNEVRWGDVQRTSVDIPASGVDAVIDVPGIQLINVTQEARVWSLAYQVTWSNQSAGVAGDIVSALFDAQIGVGSSKIDVLSAISVNQGDPFPFQNTVIPAYPAATIYVSVALAITAKAGGARTFTLTLNAQAAPVFR